MKRCSCFILFLLVCILATQLSVFATGFETKSVSDSVHARVANRFSFSKYNSQKRPFQYFDVNEDGMILLVSDHGTPDQTVYVYNKEGAFQYKYTVDTVGAVYAEWNGPDLWIYLVRSNVAVLVNDQGKVLKVEEILNTGETASHWSELSKWEKTVGDKTYTSRSGLGVLGIFVDDNARLIESDANGTERVLYDAGTSGVLKTVLMTMLFIALFIFVGVSVIIFVVKRAERAQNKAHYGSPYKPNAKRSFCDRIFDFFERSAEKPSNDENEPS